MNIEELRDCCFAVKNAEECTPFGKDVLVYKITYGSLSRLIMDIRIRDLITVNSSPYALIVYGKLGFTATSIE